jgi:hypothetical protein
MPQHGHNLESTLFVEWVESDRSKNFICLTKWVQSGMIVERFGYSHIVHSSSFTLK